jgi:hypothetical protein
MLGESEPDLNILLGGAWTAGCGVGRGLRRDYLLCNTSLPHVLLRGLCNLQHIVLTTIDTTSFGTVATLLEMIPVASVLFSFTNTGKFQTNQLAKKKKKRVVVPAANNGHSRSCPLGGRYRRKGNGNGRGHSSGAARDGQESRVRRLPMRMAEIA